MKILIREARLNAGLTLKQLSMITGISIKQLSKIENNLVDPKLSTMILIAKALRVQPESLFLEHERWWD